MFQNKKANDNHSGNKINLSQKNDLPLEDLPIQTMKKDLEEIKNPGLIKPEAEYQEAKPHFLSIEREKLTETQKSSPFLDFSNKEKISIEKSEFKPELPKKTAVDSRVKIVETAPRSVKISPNETYLQSNTVKTEFPNNSVQPVVQKNQAEKPAVKTEKDQRMRHINLGKTIIIVLAFLIIAASVGGGYYFWVTRQKNEIVIAPSTIESEPIIESEPELKPEPIMIPPTVIKFSTSEPNIFEISTATAASGSIKENLQELAAKVALSGISLPVEFNVVDVNKKPIAFKDFAKLSGITFSQALLANLSGNFSLFIYNDGGATRTGLVIDSKYPTKLKYLMMAEEKTLAKSVDPIFLATNYTLADKTFASSDYKGTIIRYINIISPEDLSVDYAMSKNKLIIGTTKMTLRSIIDCIEKTTVDKAIQVEDSLKTIESDKTTNNSEK
jgi:hypothetical protein